MTLTEFLLARIGEDEETAEWAAEGTGDHEPGCCTYCDAARTIPNPARVLAECEAKRLIVAEHQTSTEWDDGINACTTCQWDIDCDAPKHDHQRGSGRFPCPTLRFLALPYADHPDYDEAWRP